LLYSVQGSWDYDKQPNIRYASGDPLYRWSFASVAVFPDQEARWLYELQFRMILKIILKKKE